MMLMLPQYHSMDFGQHGILLWSKKQKQLIFFEQSLKLIDKQKYTLQVQNALSTCIKKMLILSQESHKGKI